MKNWLVYTLGFTAQLLFSGRMISQWFLSERSKKVITPNYFWHASLLASCLLFLYGYLRNDFAIMLGQFLTYFIYIRNLQIEAVWSKLHYILRYLIYAIPIMVIGYVVALMEFDLATYFKNENIPGWLVILGIAAQLIFVLRFVYQWLYSERKRRSSLPLGFWLLSTTGSSMIIIYAVLRKDPVLFAGHIFGLIMYLRNIYIHINEVKG